MTQWSQLLGADGEDGVARQGHGEGSDGGVVEYESPIVRTGQQSDHSYEEWKGEERKGIDTLLMLLWSGEEVEVGKRSRLFMLYKTVGLVVT